LAEEQKNEASIVDKPAFRAVGMRWEGTFAEAGAGGIRAIQKRFRERLGEIEGAKDPGSLLGLSYHAYPGGEGFVHYAAIEVGSEGEGGEADVPEGMAAVTVPALAYASCRHRKGQSIDRSYRNLYQWIEEQGYAVHPGELTHFEIYPMEQDPYDRDPEFEILIPVAPKK